MNIFVTGGAGMVGSHLVENLQNQVGLTLLTPTANELDITDKKAVVDFFQRNRPDIMIHFAAFTDVAAAQKQRGEKDDPCWIINVTGTKNLITAAENHQTRVIHISTDFVFSGKKIDPGPYREDHPIATDSSDVNWYGWTKAEAERAVKKYHDTTIVRIANPVRAVNSNKLDYIQKILAYYDNGQVISLFEDQYLTLTAISDVTRVCRQLIEEPNTGVFHVGSRDRFTPFELGEYVLEKARQTKNAVQKSSLEKFIKNTGDLTRYPQYGGLSVSKTEDQLGIQFDPWKLIVDKIITKTVK